MPNGYIWVKDNPHNNTTHESLPEAYLNFIYPTHHLSLFRRTLDGHKTSYFPKVVLINFSQFLMRNCDKED